MTPPLAVKSFRLLPGPGNRFRVCLGGGEYTVDADAGTCTCPSWTHRHAREHSHCKHLAALLAHLQEERACAACHGNGILRMREAYADNGTALPCARCDGSGLRAPSPAMTDAELRRLFG